MDRARGQSGQPVTSGGEANRVKVTEQDGCAEKMNLLIAEAKDMLALQKQAAVSTPCPRPFPSF